jgi:hypothetical protein
VSITHKIVSNIPLSKLTPYAEKIIGDHQYGFRHKSNTDHKFRIRQIFEGKKCKYNEAVHQRFMDFKKANDSVRNVVLCNIIIEFGDPTKLVMLIKMCLYKTYNRDRVDNCLKLTVLKV